MTEWVASGLFSVDPGRAGAAPPVPPWALQGVGDGKVVSAVIVVCVAERGRGVFAGCCGGAVRGGGRAGGAQPRPQFIPWCVGREVEDAAQGGGRGGVDCVVV